MDLLKTFDNETTARKRWFRTAADSGILLLGVMRCSQDFGKDNAVGA